MKKKFVTILVVLIALMAIFSIVACNPNKNGDNGGGGAKVNIAILPDLLDCGQEIYLQVPKAVYESEVKNIQLAKLADKQEESREDYKGEDDWSNDNYYPFYKPKFNTVQVGGRIEWEWDEDDATTVTKIFCYSTPDSIIDVMSRAGLGQARMVELVEYITRSDEAYKSHEKGSLDRYPLSRGSGSAIWDYDNLDEIEDIRDNFSDYAVNGLAFGYDEDFWSDLAKLKKRKIDAEIFKVFDDEAPLFARFQTEYMLYQIQVLSKVMIPAYKNAIQTQGLKPLGSSVKLNNIIDSEEFKGYMREEIFDFGMLSNLLAFADMTNPQDENNDYLEIKIENKKYAMLLYGYTYQYEKRSYEVFDDSKIIAKNGKTEYEDYLWLSHKKYFDDNMETGSKGLDLALRFTEYDRRNYEKAYRYSASFYKKYYEAQYVFQSLQEKRDIEVYKDDIEYIDGIGHALKSKELTYSDEMLEGLTYGFAEGLKISDVQWEYSGVDSNVGEYNKMNTDWNRLTENQKAQSGLNAIKKVRLQIEQLKSQKYVLDHKTLEESDFVSFLKYQIKSYSADYVRAIQDNKKEQVINRWKLKRAYQYFTHQYDYTEILDEFDAYNPESYEKDVVKDKIGEIGRTKAMYQNIYSNYSGADIEGQILTPFKDWKDVSNNIRETLSIDYERYNTEYGKGNVKLTVDDYFEENLIKKEYDCKGTENECGYGGAHPEQFYVSEHRYVKNKTKYDETLDQEIAECEKVYDTEWSISRLLNAHEAVFRHMSGQTEIEFKKVKDMTNYYDDQQPWGTGQYYTSDKVQKITAKRADWTKSEIVTLDAGDALETKVWIEGKSYNYQPTYDVGKGGVTRIEDSTDKVKKEHYTECCYYIFDAWCVDEDLLYEVRLDDKVRFDIRLYPRYRIENEERAQSP